MKERKINVIPSLVPIYENGKHRKHRVGGYMRAVYNGHYASMDRTPSYDYFEDVVGQYPNWELTEVFEDIIIEEPGLTTLDGILSALQASIQKKIDILLIRSRKDLLGTINDTSLLKEKLFLIGIRTYFILENLHYSSPYDFSCYNELPFE
jgi:hypothetical protein